MDTRPAWLDEFKKEIMKEIGDKIKIELEPIKTRLIELETAVSLRLHKRKERIKQINRDGVRQQVIVARKYLSKLFDELDTEHQEDFEQGVKLNMIIVGIGSLLDTLAYAEHAFHEDQLVLKDDSIYFRSYKFQSECLSMLKQRLEKLQYNDIFFFDAVKLEHFS